MSDLRDLHPTARVAIFGTIAFGVMQVITCANALWSNSVISAYLADESSVGIEGLNQVDQVAAMIALVFLLVFIVAVTINGRWIYLASSNAAKVVPNEDRIRPGWAVGWFFIPIASLWMPFKAMKQTWAASIGGGQFESATPTWLTIWWASWVLLNLSDGISSNVATTGFQTLESLQSYNYYIMITGMLWLIPTYLFIRLIKEVTAAQRSDADVFA